MKLYLQKRVGKQGVSWQGTVYLTEEEGGPSRVPAGTYRLKGEAQAAGEVVMDKLRVNLGITAPDMTVAQMVDRWFQIAATDKVRPKTLSRYRELARLHIMPRLGTQRAAETTKADIATWQSSLLAGDGTRHLSASTVRQARSVLHSSFKWAVNLDLLAVNPVERVAPPALKQKPTTPPSPKKVRDVIEASRGTELYRPVVIIAYTGLRRGEALALRWCDIDLTKREARIFRSLSTAESFSMPKTLAGDRTIALPAALVKHLRSWRGDEPDDTLICCHEDGAPLDPETVSHNFYHLLKRRKVDPMRLHDFRHAVASQMLEAGIRPDAVAAHLGHANIAVTIGTYGHFFSRAQHDAVAALDRVMDGRPLKAGASTFQQAFSKRPKKGRRPRT